MKNLYIFLLLLVGVVGFGQTLPGVDSRLSPKGFLETIFDKSGNKYTLSDIKAGQDKMINNTLSKSTVLCNSGIFDLYFETGSGMESTTNATEIQRRAVVCQVFNDLSNFIVSPLQNAGNTTRVKIWVRNITNISGVPSNALGLATAFYNLPQNTTVGFGGIADNEVWKTITAGKDSYINVTSPLLSTNTTPNPSGSFYHGMMSFNFTGVTWNTNLAINAPVGQYDLYSVVLHEVTHALGFASLMDANGQSVFGAGFNYFSRYDKFLKNNAGTQFLITNGTACSSMYNYNFNTNLPISTLHPSTSCLTNQTTCANAIKFVGTSTVPVYTTNCFEPGSSLSHFEDLCVAPNVNDGYFTMSNAIATGKTKRFLKFQERNALVDIGYKLNTTFGNNTTALGSFNNYGGAITNVINVAGINDGINLNGTYSYLGSINTPITINSTVDVAKRILANDTNAIGFECLQNVFSTSTFSATSGTNLTNITFTSAVEGLHLLRYVPINATGVRGNLTYVYVYVLGIGCTPLNACNLINNGGYESNTNCGQFDTTVPFPNVNCWFRFSGTPDLYKRSCTNGGNLYNLPLSFPGGLTTNTWDNKITNTSMIGLWALNTGVKEGIQGKLNKNILAGKKYSLSFKAKVQSRAHQNLIQANLPTKLVFGGSSGLIVSGSYQSLPSSMTNLGEVIVPNNNIWNTFTVSLNISTIDLDFFAIMNTLVPNLDYGIRNSYVVFDDIEIVPENELVNFNLPLSICTNQSISNLSTLLNAPFNGVFESTGNGVILSNGIYSFDASLAGFGNHIITFTYTNLAGCTVAVSKNIQINAVYPTFSNLRTANCTELFTSLPLPQPSNGIVGTWSPMNYEYNVTTYIFTPLQGQCFTGVYTHNLEISAAIIPTFNISSTFCASSIIASLPLVSDNGVTGTWSPALNNTATTTYTFTPTAGQCATTATMTITVLPANDPACNTNPCLPNLTLNVPETNSTIIYKRLNWIETNTNYVTTISQNIKMLAGDYINLKTGTHIKSGSSYLGKIEACTATSKVSFQRLVNPEGIKNDEVSNAMITIYPNPTKESVTIASTNSKIKSIVVSSVEGKTCFINSNVNNEQFLLDANSYQNGIYIITIETIDGKIERQKLVKN